MKILKTKRYEESTVILEKGKDFKETDLEKFMGVGALRVSSRALTRIAQKNGLGTCEFCGNYDEHTGEVDSARFRKEIVEEDRAMGIIKKFDDLGRLVIPSNIRKEIFGTRWTEGRTVEVSFNDGVIILKPVKEVDICSGNREGVGEKCESSLASITIETGNAVDITAAIDDAYARGYRTAEERIKKEAEETSIFDKLVEYLRDYPDGDIWTIGNEILCSTEGAANAIADMIQTSYRESGKEVCVNTGYYDPEEDKKNGEENWCTGWWYVNIN